MTIPGVQFDHFYTSDRIDLYYYPELKIMHFIWKTRSVGEDYRAPFYIGLKYA
jgi:hypothetical protein